MEKLVVFFSWTMTFVLCLCLSIFLTYLLIKGLPSLGAELIFGKTEPFKALLGQVRVFDGIFPAMVGTFFLVLLSALLALPVGVCSGIYLAEYANPGMKILFGGLFDILAVIPALTIRSPAVLYLLHFEPIFESCRTFQRIWRLSCSAGDLFCFIHVCLRYEKTLIVSDAIPGVAYAV